MFSDKHQFRTIENAEYAHNKKYDCETNNKGFEYPGQFKFTAILAGVIVNAIQILRDRWTHAASMGK